MTAQNQKNQVPTQGNQEAKAAAEAEAKAEQEAKAAAEAEAKKTVNLGDYEEFCELKFMVLDGARLKDQAKKKLAELEEKLRGCNGPRPKKTVTASIGMDLVRLVEGIPVPPEIVEKVGENNKHYF